MKPGFPVVILLGLAASTAVAFAASPQLQLGQELLPPDAGSLPPADSGEGLKLRLQARFDCGIPGATARLFVSVADTAVATGSAQSPQSVVVELPDSQLRGVRESLACPGLGSYLMRAQLTAYATLICRNADGTQASTTVNRPIDLWVECQEISTESSEGQSEEALEET